MVLKYIRLYSRLLFRSSFLAKWLGERVRAKLGPGNGLAFFFSSFFCLSYVLLMKGMHGFLIINEALTQCLVKLHNVV